MKTATLLVVLLLHALVSDAGAQAGAANVIKKRARETAGRPAAPKNGAPGGRTPVRAPSRSATPAPAARAKSPQRQIESDLALIRIKRGVTDELRDQLAGHILEAAGEGAKPDADAVRKLAHQVATAMQEHKTAIGYGERKRLAEALVLASGTAGGRTQEATVAIDELNAALRKAEVPEAVVNGLVGGLKGLALRVEK